MTDHADPERLRSIVRLAQEDNWPIGLTILQALAAAADRIDELEAERTKMHAALDEMVDECGADWIVEAHGLKWSSADGWHIPKDGAS